ncbi:hypothetical protein Nepgr_029168 [Nepenthes gracilis]|uniref:Aspartate racemase n=1 Tax=Nepenthes gracilis TaxID=150966 RepID=A0AAD3TD36_NEPGR|nr:hypothetical protein Nepgr_029168 [Nepenthes gracilis]
MNIQAAGISDLSISMLFHTLNYPPLGIGDRNLHRTSKKSNTSSMQLSSSVVQRTESKNPPKKSRKISGTFPGNTVGIIGGVSVFSTLIFLEKLIWWSSRDGENRVPFILTSDPSIKRETQTNFASSSSPFNGEVGGGLEMDKDFLVENLRRKKNFLEKSGVHCIVMPCHVSNAWHKEISEGCSLPFLHLGECVAKELKEANFKPIQAGSNVSIGVIGTNATLTAGFYQEKLQAQGFQVELPDTATMEHIITPAINALNRKDMEGAQNLLRIGIQILLVRAVNAVVLASDEFQGLLPHDDPLLKKCFDPMDALARSTIRWAKESTSTNKKKYKRNLG